MSKVKMQSILSYSRKHSPLKWYHGFFGLFIIKSYFMMIDDNFCISRMERSFTF